MTKQRLLIEVQWYNQATNEAGALLTRSRLKAGMFADDKRAKGCIVNRTDTPITIAAYPTPKRRTKP
jgi:hypothetical protein